MKICFMDLDTYSFASWDNGKNGIICKADLHSSLIWDKHIVLNCQEPEWIFQDFPNSEIEGSLYLLKGSCIRPSVGHFFHLTLKIAWGGGVIKCGFVDEEIEPQRDCLELPEKVLGAVPEFKPTLSHSNTSVPSHHSLGPPAVCCHVVCMHTRGRWSSVPHTVIVSGTGTCWTEGSVSLPSHPGARLLRPQLLWATFSLACVFPSFS